MSAKPQQVMLSHLEVVTALVKAQGLHAGIWQLTVTFGRPSPMHAKDGDQVFPAVAIPVLRIGLIQVDAINPLAVDAAVINPRPRLVLPEFGMRAN